ncbi:sensor histidine kinase [Phytohabitans rumicis]|uniref:Histidine kinase/HSP90-like ATPase domain-containing protein n=1 Tax=Phytohabitans rumicis TaxID=1076125 RepID=A0A6V8LAR0_9ACTN|nr:ATP-binding protein [Phytohabitans rumicis]GFJ94292.1 hypothetical protein Prum_079340 [Phytohabitans rumicis]
MRLPTAVAGLSGCALLAVAASPGYQMYTPFLGPTLASNGDPGWWKPLLVSTVAALAGLCLLRFWPYLLLAAGLLSLPRLAAELSSWPGGVSVSYLQRAAVPLALIGVLAAAQSLVRGGDVGWGAAVGGTAAGAQLFGAFQVGAVWLTMPPGLKASHAVLTVVGLAGAIPALVAYRDGDPDAGLSGWGWQRSRYVLAGGLAAGVGVFAWLLTSGRTERILDLMPGSLYRHPRALLAAIGLAILVAAVILAAAAGAWSLAGGLTAAVAQVALVAPLLLAAFALAMAHPTRWFAALAGVALGAVAAALRWRIPIAAALAVLAAAVCFILYAGTSGDPEKLVTRRTELVGALLLILIAATATALIGAVTPVLAKRGAAPAVLGFVVAAMTLGGQQLLQVTYLDAAGGYASDVLEPVRHITSSATLMLVAAAGLGGLALAELFAARRAERRMTELVRREAAEAERNRLARPIHDGVLQVLALMQRHGPELGERGTELAELAGDQEAALRTLISSEAAPGGGRDRADLRTALADLASPTVHFAVPANAVDLPAHAAQEVRAAVAAALDNVARHAGPTAQAWVLVEDEPDGVRVTVRDDGLGIPEGRLAEAAEAGRLGVAQSMRGRIADLGGATTVTSRPGEGTEVEFWLPRRPGS